MKEFSFVISFGNNRGLCLHRSTGFVRLGLWWVSVVLIKIDAEKAIANYILDSSNEEFVKIMLGE